MSRLVVVSNRVAPITEGEPTAGGLAAGVLDALKQKGGIWFGWSGEVTADGSQQAQQTVGPITLFTIDLSRRDYDEFYRGFANDTLWPVLHYQIGLHRFEWPEFDGYRRVNDAVRPQPGAAGAAGRPGLGARLPSAVPGRRVARAKGCATASACSCTRRSRRRRSS